MNLIVSPKCKTALLLSAAVSLAITVQAAPRPGRAITVSATGVAEYHVEGQSDWKQLTKGLALSEGASTRTGGDSFTDFSLNTDARVGVTANTIIRFDQVRLDTQGLPQANKKPNTTTIIELERGKVLVQANSPTEKSMFAVTTRACLAEVRGFGAYSVTLINDRACVRVKDQTVTVVIRGRVDPVVLQAGQQLCTTCDPRTNQAVDSKVEPTPITDPDPDPNWPPSVTPPPPPYGPTIESPPVYQFEISPSKP